MWLTYLKLISENHSLPLTSPYILQSLPIDPDILIHNLEAIQRSTDNTLLVLRKAIKVNRDMIPHQQWEESREKR